MPISSLGLNLTGISRRLPEAPREVFTTTKANGCKICERTFKTYWTETLYAKDGKPISVLKGNLPKFVNK